MRDTFNRLGYPGSAWHRPMLWTLLAAFVTLTFATGPSTLDHFSDRTAHALWFLVIGGCTGRSWQKHRQVVPQLLPLGRVEWPADER